MPEGDTIFRAARTLHRALAGKPVTRFESVYPALTRVHVDTPLTSRIVEQVSAAGKHLLMHFSEGLILRTHMRMNGSWHIYRPGEPWQRPWRDMRVLIATRDFVAVAFNVPVAEFIRIRRSVPSESHGGNEVSSVDSERGRPRRAWNLQRRHPLRQLGPDLLSEDFDEAEALRRMRARETDPIADVLLDQRIMAGIGNVYKSEVLFACAINPFVAVSSLDDDALRNLIATSRRLLLANVSTSLAPMTTYTGFRRTTRRDNPQDRVWVYGRRGRPCRRCGMAIESRKHGPGARLTYWCSNCQKP